MQVIACEIVKRGLDRSSLTVPIAHFGGFVTVDRSEIESYRSIRNLITEYINSGRVKRPLSIAVFGPPGSGKSYGVKQIARSISKGDVEDIEFSLAQFTKTEDLVNALHRVRDIVLEGKLPLVFFDEFDCDCQGKLGWLKYFLAPMQDGEFRDGESVHPIGKSIFVFAGGTKHSFEQFCDREDDNTGGFSQGFIDVKGPDFLSRLRGYINITGINPRSKTDSSFMIRRAVILRNCLEAAAGNIVAGSGNVDIDNSVLLAMLKVPEYKHGVRSMLAIIEMSSLSGRRKFEQSSLPSLEQLELHVDSEAFSRLLLYDTYFQSLPEALPRAIHEQFCEDNRSEKSPGDPAMRPWNELDRVYRKSNWQFANQIPEKLYMIGCSLWMAMDGKPEIIGFSDNETEELAKDEHGRFVAERLINGWKYGDRDNIRKRHPLLKDWDELDDRDKEQNRQMVRRIPEYLGKAGLGIYRIKEGRV